MLLETIHLSKPFGPLQAVQDVTVRENIRLAVQSRGNKNFHPFQNANTLKDVESRTTAILGEVGLKEIALKKVGAVAYGYQRSLEAGIALATHPVLREKPRPPGISLDVKGGERVSLLRTKRRG